MHICKTVFSEIQHDCTCSSQIHFFPIFIAHARLKCPLWTLQTTVTTRLFGRTNIMFVLSFKTLCNPTCISTSLTLRLALATSKIDHLSNVSISNLIELIKLDMFASSQQKNKLNNEQLTLFTNIVACFENSFLMWKVRQCYNHIAYLEIQETIYEFDPLIPFVMTMNLLNISIMVRYFSL